MNEDLKVIKKKYGENMMRLCRELFPTILEQEGLLSQIMLEHFEPSHELYNDIIANDLSVKFKNYIYSIIEIPKPINEEVNKTPEELLASVGYDLYECSSKEEIQRFEKYYREYERLCTFRGNRLDDCYVFFAVKKNVAKIKRERFENPQRQDLYGTSVISIQFTRDEAHTLSIKNRYNHTVPNPDATFSNNLDNIIQGLTESFEKYYGMSQKQKNSNFEIPNYVCAEGKYYKYNYEINNIYYCPNNIIINNFKVYRLPKEKYLLFDYFILNLVNKKISLYDGSVEDSFVDDFNNIDTVEIKKQDNEKTTLIKNSSGDIFVKLDKNNKIISYVNNTIEKLGSNFLSFNTSISELYLPKVKTIGSKAFINNNKLRRLSLPEVETIDSSFLRYNQDMEELYMPRVQIIEFGFLGFNRKLKKLSLPEVEEIAVDFLKENQDIEELYLPKVRIIHANVLSDNKKLKKLSLPEVETIGDNFLEKNEDIEELYMPKVRIIYSNFLASNKKLKKLSLPEVKEIGNGFLASNKKLKKISLPEVRKIGNDFLLKSNLLTKIKFYLQFVRSDTDSDILDNKKNKVMVKK